MTSQHFEELEKRAQKIRRVRIGKMMLFFTFIFLSLFSYFYMTKPSPVVTQAMEQTPPASNVEPLLKEPVIEKEPEVLPIPNEDEKNYNTISLSPHIKDNSKPLPKEEELPSPSFGYEVKNVKADETKFLKEFYANNNFEAAYQLALLYFNSKLYNKAIHWAKETININHSFEKAWIIYAKSYFHLGEKNEAIRSLEIYLNYFDAKETTELLNLYKGQP